MPLALLRAALTIDAIISITWLLRIRLLIMRRCTVVSSGSGRWILNGRDFSGRPARWPRALVWIPHIFLRRSELVPGLAPQRRFFLKERQKAPWRESTFSGVGTTTNEIEEFVVRSEAVRRLKYSRSPLCGGGLMFPLFICWSLPSPPDPALTCPNSIPEVRRRQLSRYRRSSWF